MLFALFACAAAFQGSLTTPVPEPGKKKPPVKKVVAPAKKPVKKPRATGSGGAGAAVKPGGKPRATGGGGAAAAKQVSVKFTEEEVGVGVPVKVGETVVCHFHIQRRNGDEIADSKKRGLPYVVKIGAAGNDPLLDLVLKGMKPGGVRKCAVAAKAVYGAAGAPPIILPNDVLVVEVTLLRRGDK